MTHEYIILVLWLVTFQEVSCVSWEEPWMAKYAQSTYVSRICTISNLSRVYWCRCSISFCAHMKCVLWFKVKEVIVKLDGEKGCRNTNVNLLSSCSLCTCMWRCDDNIKTSRFATTCFTYLHAHSLWCAKGEFSYTIIFYLLIVEVLFQIYGFLLKGLFFEYPICGKGGCKFEVTNACHVHWPYIVLALSIVNGFLKGDLTMRGTKHVYPMYIP